MTTSHVNKEFFVKYLLDFSKENPKELKILIVDNAAFHSTKDIEIPENIILINIPPYCPELNPAEKIWQWMKDKIAMKIYDSLDQLSIKINDLIQQLENQLIKSITGYEFYLKAYHNVFKD